MIKPPGANAGLLVAGIAVAVLALWGGTFLTIEGVQYLRATPLQRTRIRHGWRIRRTWKRVAMNNGLSRTDETSRGKTGLDGKPQKPRTMIPRIHVFPEPWGMRVMVRTIGKVGLDEFEKAGAWLADAWGVQSVEVVRNRPGVLEVRAVVGEPLDERFPWVLGAGDDLVLRLGRNPWGRQLSIPLRELSGVKVAGMPGYGKTMLQLGWVADLAPRPDVQFAVFDGKTADARYGDWAFMGQRAMFLVGDDPDVANARLSDIVRLIKERPAVLTAERGTHKFWKAGPTVANPLVLVVMDECHNYIDASGLRAAEKATIEANQRMMRTISKEGRGLGVIPIVATQKQTGDAIPTAVRDNLEVGVCFATFTLDGAEAALGSAIRQDEPHQPTGLVDKDRYVGAAVVTGVPGMKSQYDRVRVGDIDEHQALTLVQASVPLRRNVIPEERPAIPAAPTPADSVPLAKPRATTRRKTP